MSLRPLLLVAPLALAACTKSDPPKPAPAAEPTAKSDWQFSATAQRELVDAGPGESAEAFARAPESPAASAHRPDAGATKR